MDNHKIIALFITPCKTLENYILYRESISIKSFLDRYLILGKCEESYKERFGSTIIEINRLPIKKNFLEYLEIDLKSLKSNLFECLKFLKSGANLKIYNLEDKEIFYKLSSHFVDVYLENIYNQTGVLFNSYLETPKKSFSDIRDLKVIVREEAIKYKKYTINSLKAKKIDNKIDLSNSGNISFKFKELEYPLEELYYYENLNKAAKRKMDFMSEKMYTKISKITKIFKNVKSYISENYTKETVSQAFLKMYEILEIYDLFDLKSEVLSSFHFCEAPGQFIKACLYYLESKGKKLDWHAQSLNSKMFGGNVIGDDYGLIKDNPNRWLFGPDNSGDITNIKVIKSYKSVCQNVSLITSDCGLGSNTNFEMTYQDKRMAKINYMQLIAILYNLPAGGNFVAKVFLPQSVNYLVSLNYIISKSFKNFYIYKPYLNPSSSEVYLIGKNYKPLTKNLMNYLFEKSKDLKIEKGFIDIPKPFLDKYSKLVSKLLKNNLEKIIMNLSFYKEKYRFDKEKLNDIYEDNVQFWIKLFKFPKVEKSLDSFFL